MLNQHFEPNGASESDLPRQRQPVAFVLFFVPRTGSNMVRDWVGTHPAVRFLPAIFGKKAGWRPKKEKPGRGGGAFGWLRSNIGTEWDDQKLRSSHPRKLIREIVAKSSDKAAIGFKHHLADDTVTDVLLRVGAGIRKILLVRNNLLASYSSEKIAHATGQGTVPLGETVLRATVPFDPWEFEDFVEARNQKYLNAREKIRKPFIEVEYTRARTEEGIQQIAAFLDLDPESFGSQQTTKRNSDAIVSRFSNPEIVSSYLKDNRLEHWAEEK